MNSQSSSESAIYSPPFCQQVGGADECRPATGTAHNARLPLFVALWIADKLNIVRSVPRGPGPGRVGPRGTLAPIRSWNS